jgi:hypothetical protein
MMPTQIDLFNAPTPMPTRKIRVSAHERTIPGQSKPSTPERAQKPRNAAVIGIAETSRAAYRETQVGPAAILRERVYAFIRDRGTFGATDQEIQHGLSLHEQSQGPRRNELVKASRVRNSGLRRETRSGRTAIVWVAA